MLGFIMWLAYGLEQLVRDIFDKKNAEREVMT